MESEARLFPFRPTSSEHPTPPSSGNAETVTVRTQELTDCAPTQTAVLVRELLDALEVEQVEYCHWKSNVALDRSATGENDLDLLVPSSQVPRFTQILYRLGFKQAQAPADQNIPGVLDYYGYDKRAGKLIHVHAHYRLVLGDDRTKNYHLSIEKAFFAATNKRHGFRIPSPDVEFMVLVIRMVLKHSTWDAIFGGKGNLSQTEREEFEHLQQYVQQSHIHGLLKAYLPFVNSRLFSSCVESLQPFCPIRKRIITARQLQIALDADTRRPRSADLCLKAWRRIVQAVRRRVSGHLPRRRLLSGGAVIAFVGGDGAGKSTAVQQVSRWLSKDFDTLTLHMGKPAWSWTTTLVRGVLKIGRILRVNSFVKPTDIGFPSDRPFRFPGYPYLLREVCTARDRYLTYTRARRFANNGGIVLCDRFPIPQIRLMDGPQVAQVTETSPTNRLVRYLVELEEHYYTAIMQPEMLIILKVDPETAIRRKPEEDPQFVRSRSSEIWEMDCQKLDAHVVDASLGSDEIASQLRDTIWSML